VFGEETVPVVIINGSVLSMTLTWQQYIRKHRFSPIILLLLTALKLNLSLLVSKSSFPQLDQRIIDKAVGEWRKKLQACVAVGGGHFEHKM